MQSYPLRQNETALPPDRLVLVAREPFYVPRPSSPCFRGTTVFCTRNKKKAVTDPHVPSPVYDSHRDAVMCSVRTKFGYHGWEVPPLEVEMFDALNGNGSKKRSGVQSCDSFRWFARFLFEGKVLPELSDMKEMLTDIPSLITRQIPVAKAELLVSALSNDGIDNAAALRKHWAEVDDKFLFSIMKKWIKPDRAVEFKKLWIQVVKHNIRLYKESLNSSQVISSNT